jgi:hypothetical protein
MKKEIHGKKGQHAQTELREERQREVRERRGEERDKGKKESERTNQ